MKIHFSCSCNLGPNCILDFGNTDITNLMTLINISVLPLHITNNSAIVIHGSATRGRHPSICSRMTPRRRLLLQNCTTFIHLRLFSFYFTFGFTLPPPSLPPPPPAAAVGFCTGRKPSSNRLAPVLNSGLGSEPDTPPAELVSFTFHWSSCRTEKKEADLFQ